MKKLSRYVNMFTFGVRTYACDVMVNEIGRNEGEMIDYLYYYDLVPEDVEGCTIHRPIEERIVKMRHAALNEKEWGDDKAYEIARDAENDSYRPAFSISRWQT